jgi:hypothetical protein
VSNARHRLGSSHDAFENETFTIEHAGMTITVMDGQAGGAMPAKRSSSMLRARGGAAGDDLVLRDRV